MKICRFLLFFLALAISLSAAKKKNVDDTKTQKLSEAPEPPAVASGDATRLVFHVSPLSAKGLLSQQARDALAAIFKANGGAIVIHLRAFVAGSGDLRRIPQIVSDVFARRHAPLPSVSVVQVGALPLEGAQVLFESVSEARKPVNPSGVSFTAAQDSVDRIPAGALAVTCFLSDLAKASEITARFPHAAVAAVQTQRLPPRPVTECQAVVPGGKTGRYAFSGTQAAFGFESRDANLAFERIGRELTAAGLTLPDVVLTNIYALTKPIADMALKARPAPGEYSTFPVEGIAASDASFAVDVIANSSH
ncbi:MAG TPA: hypothetical protein VEF06_02435 [Bryobacteraceae bacterium]|nr:hypothetical protein [Bryobacteraceae bacterium]